MSRSSASERNSEARLSDPAFIALVSSNEGTGVVFSLMPCRKRTIQRKVEIEGKGLYFSEKVKVVLHPASEKTGIIFLTPGGTLALDQNSVQVFPTCSSLITSSNSLFLLEHFLSACWAMKIGNLIVDVTGKELPIFDGSSREWLLLLQKGQPIEQDENWEDFSLPHPILINEPDRFLAGIPFERFRVCYSFIHPEVGTYWVEFSGDEAEYEEEIAGARTFATEQELLELQKSGWVLRPDEDCGVLFREKIPHIPLRYPDEPARHKILDLLGDLYVFPKRLKGLILAFQSGHKMNHQFVTSLFSATL